jgi:uncharacterized repeat protein (TIGR01451 family)
MSKPLVVAIAVAVLAIGLIGPTPSRAALPGPHWAITSTSLPTYFKLGDAADEYTLIVMNDGGEKTNGSTVTVTDTLPGGLTATAIIGEDHDLNRPMSCPTLSTCTFSGKVAAGDFLEITLTVSVAAEPQPTETSLATVSGGGASSASVSDQTTISSVPVPFGLSYLTTNITDMGGGATTQAGSHPFQMTTSLAFNSGSLEAGSGLPLLNADAKDVEVALPPGLVGDPSAVPQCSQALFHSATTSVSCPADTQVGLLRVFFYGKGTDVQTNALYNLAPPPGQPAELGFTVGSGLIHIPIFFHVRSEGDYGLTVRLSSISEGDPVRASILTVWGVPADPSHDSWRIGLPSCGGGGCSSEVPLKPFLTLPSSCPSEGLPGIGLATDSWQSPGRFGEEGLADLSDPSWVTLSSSLPSFTGCGRLSFSPSIAVAPDTTQAGAPSGYTVDLKVPQNDDPAGLATPTLRDATVALPSGTVVSPGVADGLQACTDEQFGLHHGTAGSCPPASQIGTVLVRSPDLSNPLEGRLFVGQPNCGPCSPADAASGKMVRVFMEAEGSGVTVKREGHGSIGQGTGSLTTTFTENPQLPFSDLKLTLKGGPRAPLANPTACGAATTTSDLRPWSAPYTPDATPSSSFEVTGCAPPQFHPTLAAGTVDNQAGEFSPFTLTLTRADQEQDLQRLTLRTPPGLLGMLSKVQLCPEPLAAQGGCTEASKIGHVTVGAGAGSNPLYVPQTGRPQDPVYLTGPYDGAPFGLSIVVPAEAGPFNLGTVVVRSAIYVDPHTAQITIVSDPLPTVLDGVPLHVRTIDVAIDRQDFMFNPTDCEPLGTSGAVASDVGTSAVISTHFQAVNCATLPFKPSFSASTQAQSSKAKGASLDVRVGYPSGRQANIASIKVSLPKQLPSRLTTLQHACPEATFAANPAGCPVQSNIGTAFGTTPVLNTPIAGPVYIVSHGGAAFPDVVVVLQGEGVAVDLTGGTSIAKGITTSTFASIPDVPISSFELKLPEGPHSVLSGNLPASRNGDFCATKLTMPTTIVGQNGARIEQSTKVAVTGCPKARAATRRARGRSRRRR